MIVPEAIWRLIDCSVRILGGRGMTGASIVARIYDGPSQVHRWSLLRGILKGAQ